MKALWWVLLGWGCKYLVHRPGGTTMSVPSIVLSFFTFCSTLIHLRWFTEKNNKEQKITQVLPRLSTETVVVIYVNCAILSLPSSSSSCCQTKTNWQSTHEKGKEAHSHSSKKERGHQICICINILPLTPFFCWRGCAVELKEVNIVMYTIFCAPSLKLSW